MIPQAGAPVQSAATVRERQLSQGAVGMRKLVPRAGISKSTFIR